MEHPTSLCSRAARILRGRFNDSKSPNRLWLRSKRHSRLLQSGSSVECCGTLVLGAFGAFGGGGGGGGLGGRGVDFGRSQIITPMATFLFMSLPWTRRLPQARLRMRPVVQAVAEQVREPERALVAAEAVAVGGAAADSGPRPRVIMQFPANR